MAASTPVGDAIDYAERWRQIVERRRVYLDDLYGRLGRDTSNYWATRSDFFRPSVRRQDGPDAFLARVMAQLQPDMTVLDVGAGGGRYAIPLCSRARQVVAVEPAAPMVQVMREEAELAGADNLRVVASDWGTAAVDAADIVICSHVIYPIADVEPFLRKLDEKTRGVCLLYLNAGQPPWEMQDLWLQFHDQPARPQPTYIDADNLLHQMGIYANVEVIAYQRPRAVGAGTFEEAAERLRETLVLDRHPETTARLHRVLRDVLAEENGVWSLPPRPARAAIISWTAEQRAG